MSPDLAKLAIVEGRASQTAVVEEKSARFDQIDRNPETRRQPQQCPSILRNVGFKQGEAQTNPQSSARERALFKSTDRCGSAELCGSLSHSSASATV
jgi:hypothetical protein